MADATTILRELVEAMQMKERRLGGGVISGRPVALFGWFKDDIEAAYQRAAEHVAGVPETQNVSREGSNSSLVHEASGRTAEELWLQTGALRSQLADMKATTRHIATVTTDPYGSASVQWVVKPNELESGTKLYAHDSRVRDVNGERGMAWWNGLTDEDRSYWMKVSLGTSPAEAWAYFKRCGADKAMELFDLYRDALSAYESAGTPEERAAAKSSADHARHSLHAHMCATDGVRGQVNGGGDGL